MAASVARALDGCQAQPRDRRDDDRAHACDLVGLVQRAAKDTDWTDEALGRHLGLKDHSYVNKMFNRDKPFQLDRLGDFPDDVIEKFAALVLEARGVMVIAPVHGQRAIEMLVSGLVGVLISHRLPARAEHMAKASWDGQERRRA